MDSEVDAAARSDPAWQSLLATADARRRGEVPAEPDDPLYGWFAARGGTVGHLGQTLDGYIAAQDGDSYFVTGPENLDHLHRLRALADAIIVGAGTVAADDPRLTTRRVAGPSPLRVILDPGGRLGPNHGVFTGDGPPALYLSPGGTGRHGAAEASELPLAVDGDVDPHAVLALLAARGCAAVFVEGGGRTVSRFVAVGALDRLHLAVAPALLGGGRPAISLPPRAMGAALRPPVRHVAMGADMLFDLDLRRTAINEQDQGAGQAANQDR
jgi:riboflavin-specific deaminase-like protein